MNISFLTPEGRPARCPFCGADLAIEPADPPGDAPCPRCGHLLWFDREDPGDILVLRPRDGRLDLGSLDDLIDAISTHPGLQLVIDFGDTPTVSSALLGQLIGLKKRLDAARVRLGLRNLHPDLVEIFRIARLDRVFDLEP